MIKAYGNETYRLVAKQVTGKDQALRLRTALEETQKQLKHPLVSAKHLGVNFQVFCIDLNFAAQTAKNMQQVFINPEVRSTQAPLVSGLEDDLSLPQLTVSVERPKQIEVRFLNENFIEQTETFSDLAARWILHGIEQLNGITLIDKLNAHRQRSVKKHLTRIKEQKIKTNYKLEYE